VLSTLNKIVFSMKKISSIIFSIFASVVFAVQAVASDAVACMGKVVPGDRIAKLTANSPAGSQVVIKQIFVKKGDFVEAGAPIAILSGIDKAKASLERAEAVLSAVKTASAIRIQQQKNLVEDMKGSFNQNKRILDEKDPPRREREELEYEQESLARKISQAEGMLKLVEANEANVVAEARAVVEESKKHYAEFTLYSPISGEIIELHTERGEAVGMEGVCEIANTRNMFVDAEVYIADIAKIKEGDKAEITSDALKGKTFAGTVVQISGYVKSNKLFSSDPSDYSNTRVVIAKIKLNNSAEFQNLIGSQVGVRILLNK
jgi:HlyD family secretion protein